MDSYAQFDALLTDEEGGTNKLDVIGEAEGGEAALIRAGDTIDAKLVVGGDKDSL